MKLLGTLQCESRNLFRFLKGRSQGCISESIENNNKFCTGQDNFAKKGENNFSCFFSHIFWMTTTKSTLEKYLIKSPKIYELLHLFFCQNVNKISIKANIIYKQTLRGNFLQLLLFISKTSNIWGQNHTDFLATIIIILVDIVHKQFWGLQQISVTLYKVGKISISWINFFWNSQPNTYRGDINSSVPVPPKL